MSPVPEADPVYEQALVAAVERHPSLFSLDVEADGGRSPSDFGRRFPRQHLRLPPKTADVVAGALERSRTGGPVFLRAPIGFLVEEALGSIVRDLARPRANVKLVGETGPAGASEGRRPSTARDDLAAMRAVPAITVVAPADDPSVREAVTALADRDGTAYLRLPPPGTAGLSTVPFAVGRARELRAGSDLTLLGYGPLLVRLLEVARELAEVGIAARVLDLASIKPIDEAAILRAARDTGALLVAEPAPLPTGLGTLVAALTAENYPVPVRRLGFADVAPDGAAPLSLDDPGLAPERLRDEAWELLRLRGKVQ